MRLYHQFVFKGLCVCTLIHMINVFMISSAFGLMDSGPQPRVPLDTRPFILTADDVCEPAWIPTFGGKFGMDGEVHAMAIYDDGTASGPVLYVGGDFSIAGSVFASSIARWNGTRWTAVQAGIASNATGAAPVQTMVVFDDGNGPALYVGGKFNVAGDVQAQNIARWDGESWSAVGDGFNEEVRSLAVFDDGTGAALYAGGVFTMAGAVPANHIAKWTGEAWSAVGDGVVGIPDFTAIHAMTVYDDGAGSGAALYAGGFFLSAGGVSAASMARWDGTAWSAVGGGVTGLVFDLLVLDDADGPALLVAGSFNSVGAPSVPASNVARWNGNQWNALGDGVNGAVRSLEIYDDGLGAGPAIFAGGTFTVAGGIDANRIARWDGQVWSSINESFESSPAFPAPEVRSLIAFDDGSGNGEQLYVGGSHLETVDELEIQNIGQWDGQEWARVIGPGVVEGVVWATTVFDDGFSNEPRLFIGGGFRTINGVSFERIASWSDEGWLQVGSGMNGIVRSLAVYDDASGSGPALYAGGSFTMAGDVEAFSIARWDGLQWSDVGKGLNGAVTSLTVFDDGTGAGKKLIAAGSFTQAADGTVVNHIASWDGQKWAPLSSGLDEGGSVSALTATDACANGPPTLYIAGLFFSVGGTSVTHLAKWDGFEWSAVGGGKDMPILPNAIALYDDGQGNGPQLYLTSSFSSVGGVQANNIARWDGQQWHPMGDGLNASGHVMDVFDDGTGAGPKLFVGGNFTQAGDVEALRIASWDGRAWTSTNSTIGDGLVRSLAVDQGWAHQPPSLYVSGSFTLSGTGEATLSRLVGCPSAGTCAIADINCDGEVDSEDLYLLLALWGVCDPCEPCLADLNGDNVVDVEDLFILLANWGEGG